MKEINKDLPEVKLAFKALNALYAQVPESVADDVKKHIFAAFGAIEGNPYEMGLLVNLQAELGYVEGDISTVAMLGLFGEAGEVLGETSIASLRNDDLFSIGEAVNVAEKIDKLKKSIRKFENNTTISLPKKNEEKFDAELADTFYYLQILATNRGLTIPKLAKMAHDKIRAKQAAGGSSEDKKS